MNAKPSKVVMIDIIAAGLLLNLVNMLGGNNSVFCDNSIVFNASTIAAIYLSIRVLIRTIREFSEKNFLNLLRYCLLIILVVASGVVFIKHQNHVNDAVTKKEVINELQAGKVFASLEVDNSAVEALTSILENRDNITIDLLYSNGLLQEYTFSLAGPNIKPTLLRATKRCNKQISFFLFRKT